MRRLLILAMTVAFALTTSAQVNVADLRKARDYVNAKVTYLMLSEYTKKDHSVQSKWEAVKPVLEANSIDNVLPYNMLSNALAKGFSNTNLKLSDRINRIEIESDTSGSSENATTSLIDGAFQILNKSYPDIYDVVQGNKASLAEDVKKLLPKEVKQKVVQNQLISQNNDLKGNEEEPGFFSLKYFNFWTLITLLIPIAAIAFVFFSVKTRLDRHREEINRLIETKGYQGTMTANFSSPTNRDFQQYKSAIDERIIQINKAIELINRDMNATYLSNYGVKAEQKNISTPLTEPKVHENVFYMSSPSYNYFPLTAKSTNKENTLYKFITKGNKNEAEFEVINDGAPITQAASHASNYFEPACNAENFPNSNVSRIITTAPGKASFDGEKWIINNKAEIRYE
jgi:hypothetical protein